MIWDLSYSPHSYYRPCLAMLTLCTPVTIYPSILLCLPSQIVVNTGTVMSPYMDFPQLLAVLLRMLHEGSQATRKEVIKVSGGSFRKGASATVFPSDCENLFPVPCAFFPYVCHLDGLRHPGCCCPHRPCSGSGCHRSLRSSYSQDQPGFPQG